MESQVVSSDVERCSANGLRIRATAGSEEDIAEVLAAIDEYLESFAQPTQDMKCLKCGTAQTGLLASCLGGFEWGIVNGEGRCSACGWPGRAIHRIPDVGELDMLLQYHPDCVDQNPEILAKARGET